MGLMFHPGDVSAEALAVFLVLLIAIVFVIGAPLMYLIYRLMKRSDKQIHQTESGES